MIARRTPPPRAARNDRRQLVPLVNPDFGLPKPANLNRLPDARLLPPVVEDLSDPSSLTDFYLVVAEGHGMEPLVSHGAMLLVDARRAFVRKGDLVLVFRRPEVVPRGDYPVLLKRLLQDTAPWVTFPYVFHPEGEIHDYLWVETLNPQRASVYLCENLLTVHKVLWIGPRCYSKWVSAADLPPAVAFALLASRD